MNKLLYFFSLLLALFAQRIGAQTNPHDSIFLYIEHEYGSDTINVDVRIVNATDLASAQFFIHLDKSIFDFIDFKTYDYINSDFGGATAGYSNSFNSIGFVWNHPAGLTGSIPDNELILSFRIVPKVIGEYCFKFDTSRLNTLEFTTNDGVEVPSRGIPSCDSFNYAIIEGKINLDNLNNCQEDSGEKSIPRFNLNFANGANFYQTQTKENGSFRKVVLAGTYDVSIIPPNSNWELCSYPTTIAALELKRKYKYNAQAKVARLCPELEVNIIANRLRLCLDNQVSLQYFNIGTDEANNAYVHLQMDNRLFIQSSSVPFINLGDNLYRFEIGTIKVLESGYINLVIKTTCDISELNKTTCLEANIFPNLPCDINPLWSGAELKIQSKCIGSNIEFTIHNAGSGDMNTDLKYSIVEDDLMPGTQGILRLNKNQSKTILYPTNGKTIRLFTDTIAYHPFKTRFTNAIEACNSNNQTFSKGFVNRYTLGDEAPYYDVACLQLVGSYDPNDKNANPQGISDLNLIPIDSRIQYLVRFQNTGSDTAFRVQVFDEISEQLDLSSLRVEGASHPFTWNIDEGRILRFLFTKINLVDSATNEKESNGFVQYSISPVKKIKEGIKIENKADIYFDFNPAIRTNTYIHTIAGSFTLVRDEATKETCCNYYPIPASDFIYFELKENMKKTQLIMYDIFGQEVHSEEFQNKRIKFDRLCQWSKGTYFFKIIQNGKTIDSGKIIKL